MDVWNQYIGKKVFIITRLNRKYSGIVQSIDQEQNSPLIWVTINSSKGLITFVHAEIVSIEVEE